MIHETHNIRVEGSLPDARLVTYILDDAANIMIDTRPLVLICPGGGYGYTSDREAEIFAMQFLAMGYHAAVLRYSCAPARYPVALAELAKSVLLIRENAREWHVNPNQILVLGCSAGGHLAASLGVFWQEDFLAEALGLGCDKCAQAGFETSAAQAESKRQSAREMLRPDGMILCYPVITSGEFAHKGSIENLLGDKLEELEAKMSLENQVTEQTPPAFIWHTFTDGSVPVENSLLFVSALRRAGVSTEFHMYPCGGHGLGLANRLSMSASGSGVQEECSSWISLVHTWIESKYVNKAQTSKDTLS